jgi:DNA polymerase III epsilon subunit-like protein
MAGFLLLGKQRMNEDLTDTQSLWHQHVIHFLDFEGSLRSGILEYGLVTIKDLSVVELETRLCRGTGVIPEMETATHQIRKADVVDAPPLSESWELFRDLRTIGPFGAHHAGVENGLIKSVWPYTNRCLNFLNGEQDVDWGPWLDTCALYRTLFPDLESYNLSALIQAFGLEDRLNQLAVQHCPESRNTYHCAGYDALASAVLVLQLEAYEELKELTLPQLLQWSQPGNTSQAQGDQLELL